MSSSLRGLVLVVLTALLLTAGLIGPASGEPAIEVPATAAATISGLPAGSPGGRLSKPVTTPMPFSLVGFQVPAGATLEFRTSQGAGWTQWTEAEVEPAEGPDAGSLERKRANRRMSQPVWVGEATRLQTRLRGGRPTVNARQVGVHLIDSSGLGRSFGRRLLDRAKAAWRGTPPAAHATVGRPAIITRKQWGADERIRRGRPSYASSVKFGVVHHTAGRNGYTRAQADDVVRAVYRYHVKSNGWSDIGYNFLVDRFGRIYEGRYGGAARPVIGAHAGGFNTGSFGVSLIGSFGDRRPPVAMRYGLRRVLAWKFDLHHLNVLGRTRVRSAGSSKYPAGRVVRLHRLSGHRDVSSTACPGGRTYDMLSNLRVSVAKMQGPIIHTPSLSPRSVMIRNGTSVSGPMTFGAKLAPAGRWTLRVTSPSGAVVHTASGYGRTVNQEWLPTGVTPGTHRYTITSPGRRRVAGPVRLLAPVIRATASATTAVFDTTQLLRQPVSFTGQLWDGAQWRVEVTDPSGKPVFGLDGSGKALSATWRGPVSVPGLYRWRVSAAGAKTVAGSIGVTADFVSRTGVPTSAVGAAATISRGTFAPGAATAAVLTPHFSSALALAAGPLAGAAGPVLYTAQSAVPDATLTELGRVLPAGSPLYLMGDTSYISQEQADQLAQRWTVVRVNGARPSEVAAEAATLMHTRNPTQTTAMLVGVGGSAWQQGVAGTTHAAVEGMPVLLTGRDQLPPETATALQANGITKVVIVGNTSAVSEAVAAEVRDSLPPREVVRIASDTGSKTAVAVARNLFGRSASATEQTWHFANAGRDDGWVRALAAVPLRVRTRAPLLLVGATATGSGTQDYLRALDYAPTRLGRGVVLGDGSHVSAAVRSALVAQLQ